MMTVKVERAGTVIEVTKERLEFYLAHGYTVVQPETATPKPAVIKVHVMEDEPSPVEDKTELIEKKPARKPRKKKADK